MSQQQRSQVNGEERPRRPPRPALGDPPIETNDNRRNRLPALGYSHEPGLR